MTDLALSIVTEIWTITARMAPYLLLGFLVAGLLSVFISPVWLERHLGGRGMVPVLKAALLGIPLPLCSCGVIPVGASLRQHGASRAATTAFLLSTPQTGVDSVLVTWTMLGPFFAVFRPLAALLTGLLGGAAVQALDPDPHRIPAAAKNDHRGHHSPPRKAAAGLRAALRYGFLTLPADIGRALLVGLVLAGLLGALIPPDFLGRYLGQGPLATLLMMVVGIPLYVCATGSVPVAASFIRLGASPGAALAFLIAGPATNAAALTTIARVLGRKTAIIFLVTVAVSAFGGGLLLDWLLPRATLAIPFLSGPEHLHQTIGWFAHLSGAVLVAVMSGSWWVSRKGSGDDRDECCGAAAGEGPPFERLEFGIEGMNCSHCSSSVDRAVRELAGVAACEVHLDEGRAVVTGRGLRPELVVKAVQGLGFKASLRD